MTTPSSLTDIVNLALTSIGEAPINDLNTVSNTTAQVVRRWIDVVIEEVQEEIHWHELYSDLITLTVAEEDFAGVTGQFKYFLPTDFIQVYEVGVEVGTNTINPSPDSRGFNDPWWQLEGGFLISRTEGFQILYGRKDKNPANWSIQMRQVIYTTIAQKLAYEITSNEALQKMWDAKLEKVRMKAFASSQNKARSFKTRPQFFGMASARRGGGNRRNGFN